MDTINYIEDSTVEKFINAANRIHEFDPSININYGKYISIYTKASKTLLPIIAKLKLNDYIFLCKKFPNFNFDFEGRLKSEYSYFNKIIKQSIEKSSDITDSDLQLLLYDIFAFRIVLNSVSYDINDAFYTFNERRKQDKYMFTEVKNETENTFQIKPGDILSFANGDCVTVTSTNLTRLNNKIYIMSDDGSYLPLNGAKIVKNDSSTLIKAIYTIQDELLQFYKENNFEHIEDRDKDYVANPKTLKYRIVDSHKNKITNLKDIMAKKSPSDSIKALKHYQSEYFNKTVQNTRDIKIGRGKPLPCYQSLHQTYYYKPYNVYFENQIRTSYMHNVAEYNPVFGHDAYKSNRIDENSLSKLPTFITYSKRMVRGKPEYSYNIHNIEYSVKKSFGISLEEFIEQMQELHNDVKEGERDEPEI